MAFGSISGIVKSVLDFLLSGSSMVRLVSTNSRFFFIVLGMSILYYAGFNQQRELAIRDRPEETVAVNTPHGKAATVEVELLAMPGAGHGFKGADAEIAEKALIGYFQKHLK